MSDDISCEDVGVDEVNYSAILSVLWEYKKLIILGMIGSTVIATIISLLIPNVYRSEGFFQISHIYKSFNEYQKFPIRMNEKIKELSKKATYIGIPLSLYKKVSTQFFNPNQFHTIANEYRSFSPEDLLELRSNIKLPVDIFKCVKPIYAFAKEDVREFAQLPQNETNSVIGLSLTYEAYSPEKAYEYVNFLGSYIRDCLLYINLKNYIIDGYSSNSAQSKNLENDMIRVQFELLQNTNKLKDVQAIIYNYPDSTKIDSRQLVSIEDGGERFLSPMAQLVGIESTLADLRRDLSAIEREKIIIDLKTKFFYKSFNELDKIGEHGEVLFSFLKSTKDELFKNKDLENDIRREVLNSISIDIENFEFTYFQNSRYISGPTILENHIKPRRILIIIISSILSLVLFIVFALILHKCSKIKRLERKRKV